jgi:hypothetical protein
VRSAARAYGAVMNTAPPNPSLSSHTRFRSTLVLLVGLLAATFATGCFHRYTEAHFQDPSFETHTDLPGRGGEGYFVSTPSSGPQRSVLLAPIVYSADDVQPDARARPHRRVNGAIQAAVAVLAVASVVAVIAGVISVQNSNSHSTPTSNSSGGYGSGSGGGYGGVPPGGSGGSDWSWLCNGHTNFFNW